MGFKPATKEKAKLRLALMGPSGSGKTFTALEVATRLGAKVAVIDSERGSASKYADLFSFDVCELENHNPENYMKAIKEAEAAGYDVLVIDSLSHAWAGKDGILELVDKATKKANSSNAFTSGWRDVSPVHGQFVDTILLTKCHVVATMRTKTEYVLEENDRGKKIPKKVGMAPVQRDGVEYEFDVVADINLDHDLFVAKTRCSALDGYVCRKPGEEFANILKGWLETGVAPTPKPATEAVQPTASAVTAAASGGQHQSGKTSAPAKEKTEGKSSTGKQQSKGSEKQNGSAKNAGEPGQQAAGATDPNAASTSGASVASSDTAVAAASSVVGPEDLNKLMLAGTSNGWDGMQIVKFVQHAFGHDLTTLSVEQVAERFLPGEFEVVLGCISRPENAGGKVTHNSAGVLLPADHHWKA